jgi:heme exporter protein A
LSAALLRFHQVALVRGGRLLFESLDLALQPGQALLLTGPNGCGKSSLIRLAAGLLRASRGRVERGAGALADDHAALDGELPLARALGFWSGLAGEPAGTGSAMEALGIARLAQVPVRLLSAGQLKRAALARVAASRRPLWLLDEPLNGLDAGSVERLEALIAAHRASGGAVLAASHAPLAGNWARLDLCQ